MTKVTILGQEPKEEKKLKPIEFVKFLDYDFKFKKGALEPRFCDNIKLICLDYSDGFDLMFGFKEDKRAGTLYLGHFNDGVVE